jgi:hypothetical protein
MDSSSSFATLQETIANLYRIPSEEREYMEIHYTDDEGDKVIISSDIELKEALYLVHQFPQPSFRLTLTLKPLRPTNPVFSAPTPQATEPTTANLSQRILKLIGTGRQEDLLKAKNILLTEVPNSPEYRYLSECVEWFLNHPEEAGSYLLTSLNTGLISLEQFCKNPFFLNTWNQFMTNAPSYLNSWLPTGTMPHPPPPTFNPFPYSPYTCPFTAATSPHVQQTNPFPGQHMPQTTPFCTPFMNFVPPSTQTMNGSYNFTPFIFPAATPSFVPFTSSGVNQTPMPTMSPQMHMPFNFSPRNFMVPPHVNTSIAFPVNSPAQPISPELPQPISPPTDLPRPSSPQLTDDFVFPAPPMTTPQPTSPHANVQFTSELGNGWGFGNWFNNVLTPRRSPVQTNDPERWKEQLKTLEEMGWYDHEECLKALDSTNGDVLKAVEFLLSNQTSTVTL